MSSWVCNFCIVIMADTANCVPTLGWVPGDVGLLTLSDAALPTVLFSLYALLSSYELFSSLATPTK